MFMKNPRQNRTKSDKTEVLMEAQRHVRPTVRGRGVRRALPQDVWPALRMQLATSRRLPGYTRPSTSGSRAQGSASAPPSLTSSAKNCPHFCLRVERHTCGTRTKVALPFTMLAVLPWVSLFPKFLRGSVSFFFPMR